MQQSGNQSDPPPRRAATNPGAAEAIKRPPVKVGLPPAIPPPSTADASNEGTPAPKPRKRGHSTFWPCFWLAVALVGAKAVLVKPPAEYTRPKLEQWVADVAIVTGADIFYALTIALVGQAALLLTIGRRWLHNLIWVGVLAFCLASVAYGVVSARIFQIIRMPLTYPMIYLSGFTAGDTQSMGSSVAQYVRPAIIAFLIAVPVVFLVLVWLTNRLIQPRRTWGFRVMQLVFVAGLLFWFVVARLQVADPIVMGINERLKLIDKDKPAKKSRWIQWFGKPGAWAGKHEERRAADNPHLILIASTITELLGGKTVTLRDTYPLEFADDFKTIGERGGAAGEPTINLPRGPKNVIVIVCESVGTQQLSLYGSKFKTWPKLEEAAKNAVVFDNYYSHITNTANSLVTLTLGVYPPLTWKQMTAEKPDMAGVTTAQTLKGRGYRTAFISAGYNDFFNQEKFLEKRGYDVIEDARSAGCEQINSWGTRDKCMIDGVLKFIDKDRAKPFFVFSWTQQTHHPYHGDYVGEYFANIDFLAGQKAPWGASWWDLSLYLNALHDTDIQIVRLLESLRERGLAEDTIVIITGDHGEAFGHPHDSVGHSGKVYQEDVNVPLMIWSPALFKAGRRDKTVGAHVDLPPTILDLLNVPMPEGWQGRSLLAANRTGRAYFYGAMDNYILGMREGNYKYILNATAGRDELYDLSADAMEQKNIAEKDPDGAKRMRQHVAAWVEQQGKRSGK